MGARMNSRLVQAIVALALLFSITAQAAKDEIVFSTAPTDTPAVTKKIYTPLLNYLASVTGKTFVIKPAENYIEYNNNILKGVYDMTFDGPHYTGWRMERQNSVPLARLPGEITVVVILREDSTVSSMEDLVGKKICAFSSPNMLTMDFLHYFPNPARQPVLLREQGFSEIMQCLRSGKGEAAVLRDKVWDKQDQTGLKLLAQQFRSYPERTFAISDEVGPDVIEKITAAMVSEEGIKASEAMLQQFKKDKLIPANPKLYEGLGGLLAPVWGFQ